MAITDKEEGVWGLEEVYNKINQGSIWAYDAPGGDQGKFYSWGEGGVGANATNNQTRYSSPTQVGTDATWLDFGVRGRKYQNGSGIKGDGTLWSWGNNSFGELGQNNKTQRSSPVQVGTGTDWSALGFAVQKVGAIKTNGSLWTWGRNNQGQLGTNNKTYYSSPIQLPGTTWKQVSMGAEFTVATKTDGTLWNWGSNSSAQLGHNNKTQYSSPKQLPGTSWAYAWCAEEAMYAVRTDGTLWGWGRNDYGELGQNDRTEYSSPRQIPGTWATGRQQIAPMYYAASGIKSDGTLWSWGYNSSGNLGHNGSPSAHISSPTQVPGTTWSQIDGGYLFSGALKTDGTLWGWGNNNVGMLGDNTIVQRSSPIQIPGSWLNQAGALSVNWDSMYAIK